MRARVDDPSRRGDPVEAGHVEVHQHDVRLERQRLRHGDVAGLRLADERQVRLRRKESGQAGPERRRGRRRSGSGSARPLRLGAEGSDHERQAGDDSRAATGPRLDPALPAQLGRTFPHRRQTDAGSRRRWQAPAVVLDDDRELGPTARAAASTSPRRRGGRRWSSPRSRCGRPPPRRRPAAPAVHHRPPRRAAALRASPGGRPPAAAHRPGRPRRSPAAAAHRRAAGRRPRRSRPRPAAPPAALRPVPGPRGRALSAAPARIPIAARARTEAVVEVASQPPPLLLARGDEPLS